MRTTPIGQKWFIEFTDHEGRKSGGLTNHYKALPRIISQILFMGGTEIVIYDQTIYKDENNEPKDNVYRIENRR